MIRYTVFLNRPEPDNRVVVYADRYRVDETPMGSSRLIFERDGGEPSTFVDWRGVVADAVLNDSLFGDPELEEEAQGRPDQGYPFTLSDYVASGAADRNAAFARAMCDEQEANLLCIGGPADGERHQVSGRFGDDVMIRMPPTEVGAFRFVFTDVRYRWTNITISSADVCGNPNGAHTVEVLVHHSLTQRQAEDRVMEMMIDMVFCQDKEPEFDGPDDQVCPDAFRTGEPTEGEGETRGPFNEPQEDQMRRAFDDEILEGLYAGGADEPAYPYPPITDAALGHLCRLISDLVEMGHWETTSQPVSALLGDLIDVVRDA